MRNAFWLVTAALSTLFAAGAAQAETCREFTSTITVGNQFEQGVGTACLQGDGSWQIVSGPGVGNSFYDNGIPVAAPSYPVNNVYYSQPPQVQYVIQREQVYVPSSTVIISNGYHRGWNRPHYYNNSRMRYGGYRDRYQNHSHGRDRNRQYGSGYGRPDGRFDGRR